ncbi:unnamed protein product [Spirodela intermedia]|uniref:AB hydrolase-1 domain-containing protein n=1 Tax=Spirodela intermedia TaxID=51605 RepID=A0A7I8J0H7_SPIIN|nr:unnamed protein product [Spirodela intermedia]CAA6663726.1 unnamed protein product [Spirodela intermedia]
MAARAGILVPVLAALLAGWAYRPVLRPPPPRICGSPGGPPVTSPRVKLSDGRYLAYRQRGVPREAARHRIVIIHGFRDSKDISLNVSQLDLRCAGADAGTGVYIVSYDRAGYGESDPNPRRSARSDAEDIQQLADQLGLGRRFLVIGISMGGYSAWSCIKHIPHRLAGVALVVPAINYWWPSLPAELSKAAYRRLDRSDQRTFWIARHAPWLLYGYLNQKLVTPSKLIAGHPDVYCPQDKEIIRALAANPPPAENTVATQQGEYESLHRDLMVLTGDWGFEPESLPDPFDRLVPVDVQRYVAGRIPWVRYHESVGGGHLFFNLRHCSEAILEALLPHPGGGDGGPEQPAPGPPSGPLDREREQAG